MKKGPRCPVCGSLQIKTTNTPGGDVPPVAEKKEGSSEKTFNWKCYDCYRTFDKPDESDAT